MKILALVSVVCCFVLPDNVRAEPRAGISVAPQFIEMQDGRAPAVRPCVAPPR